MFSNHRNMGRIVALLLCFSLLVGFVPGGLLVDRLEANAVPLESTNLVVNGDFEASDTQVSNWSPIAGGNKVSVVTDISGNSTNVMKAAQAASAGNMAIMSNVFRVEAGNQYDISMSVLHDISVNTKNQFTITVFWFAADAQVTSANYGQQYLDYTSVSVPVPSGEWEKVTASTMAPAGAGQAMVRFTMNNGYAQCVYVDDVIVTETVTLIPEYQVYSESFEMIATSGWTASNNFSGVAVNTYPNYFEGTQSLFFQAKNVWAKSASFNVTSGKEYTVQFVTQRHNGSAPAGYAQLVFLNAEGEKLGEQKTEIASGALFAGDKQQNWNQESVTAIAPDGAVTAYIEFGRGAEGGTFGIDNVIVTEKEDLEQGPEGTEATIPSESTDPTVETEPVEPGEYLIDEQFASIAASGWTASNNFSSVSVNVYANYYEGTQSLFFQAKNVWAKSGVFAVTAGMAYVANFVTQRHSGSAPAGYAKIVFLDGNGANLSEKKADVGTGELFNGNKQQNWKAESFAALAPDGAVSAYIEFGCGATGGNFGVDNVKISQVDGSDYEPELPEESEPTEPAEDGWILNGGFEAGQANWGGGAGVGATVTVTTDDVYSGDKALLLTADKELGKATNTLTQTVSLGSATGIKISVMAKRLSGENAGYIGFWFYNANDELVPADTAYSVEIAKSNEWAEYSLTQPVPEGAVKVTVKFGNHSGKKMAYLVDDIKLTEAEIEIDTNVYAYKEQFEVIAESGWTASNDFKDLGVGVYPNYYAGSKSLFFQAKNVWAKSPAFDVTAGMAYGVSFVAQRHDGEIPAGFVKLVFLDASGKVILEKIADAGTGLKINGNKQELWKTEYVSEIAPANAVKAYIEFGRGDKTGIFGVDDVKVREIPASEYNPDDFKTPVTDQTENLSDMIENGDFENGKSGWRGGSGAGATSEIVTEGAYKGSSMLFTADKSLGMATNTFTQTLKVGSAKALKFSVMSKRLSGDNVGYAGLWFYDANDNLIPENTAFTVSLGRFTEWKEEVLIQAVPEGAVTVIIKFGNHSASTLSILVDEIKLEEYTGPADAIKPAVPGASGGGGVVYEVLDFEDLNTSFEKLDSNGKPLYWRTPGEGCSVVTVKDAPFGKNVLQFETKGNGGVVRTYPVKAEPGVTYEVKITAKDIKNSGARLGLYMFDAEGKRLDDYCVVVPTDGSGQWKLYTIVGVTPANVATIEAWVWYSTQVEACVQVDGLLMQESNIKVKPSYVPDPYTAPSIEALMENIKTEYPRVFFDGKEDAKQTKLRRFNTMKTKYGFTWNEQYESLLKTASDYLNETQVRVSMNTGKWVMMDIYPVLKDPSDLSYREYFIENSLDDNGNLFDKPYTGFGALFTEPLADRMRILSLAYIMTGKSMYAERAISYAVQVANWKVWGDEYWLSEKGLVAEASTGWMMAGMVAVYDMCHDKLTEEQRHMIERSIIEKGLKPLSEEAKPMSTVNGHMMQLGGLLSGCAAIMNEDNIEEIKPYLDIALEWAHNALSNFAYSGNTEGHYYTDFGLETFIPGLGHLYRVTGLEELIDHPFLSEMLPYWTVMWADGAHGTHPNYSDGSIGAYMKLPMAVLSKVTNNPVIDGFLITAGGTGDMFENLVYLNPDPKPAYLNDYVGIVDVIGYGVLRTGFATEDMMLTLKANDSQMNHNHYDQNSIQLNVGGSWLIKDPGAGSYYSGDRTFWTKTGHSTIMVDNNAQMVQGTASIKKVFGSSLYGYLIGSAPRSYGGDYDSEILTKFDRHAIQINHEDKGYYVVIDDLASTKDHVYTWHMFNGTRQTFAVDGAEILQGGSAMGNYVSVALGRDVLNLNFVDGDKLSVKDYEHMSSGNLVGFGIAASSAASKSHQFMTLISTGSNPNLNFIDFTTILNNRRFTTPKNEAEGDICWSSSMPLGQESVKLVSVGGTPAVFFRGNKVGDWISYPITIEETGTYNIDLMMGITDGACQVKAYLGEYETAVKDCSGLPVAVEEMSFGEIDLEAGEYTLKIEIVGPGLDEDYEPGWYLIDAVGLNLERVGVETPEVKDVTVSEVYDTPEVLGALVNYIDDKYDMLMFNRTEGAVTAGALNTDAAQASVLGIVNGAITEGFAATNAVTATYDGKVLFLAEKKVDIVADSAGWHIVSAEAQTIKLSAVESEYDYIVTVNGEPVDTKIEEGILTIALGAGQTNIMVLVEEPAPTEPSEPATEPSEPETVPTEAPVPTEPVQVENDNDNTLWIIVGVIIVLLAGAGVGIVLFLKKRKNA